MSKYKCSLHPVLIFWVGVLTGALVVGLVFTYAAVQDINLEDGFLKGIFHSNTTEDISLPGLVTGDEDVNISLPGL